MKLDPRALLAIAVLVIIGLGAYAFTFETLPYGGGGEIGSAFSSVTIEDNTWNINGQHTWPSDDRSDVDGDYDNDYAGGLTLSAFDTYLTTIQKPGISVESSYPYYLKELAKNIFIEADEPTITREYLKEYTLNNQSYAYQYNLIPYGVDITIKTDADKFYQDLAIVYGWNYENIPVDVSTLLNFGMNPWVPAGLWADANNSYSIVDGWAGILQAEVYAISYDVLQNERLEQEMDALDAGARYETDTTIQDLNSVNSALNMWIPGTKDIYNEIDFDSPTAIVGVRNAVNIEVGAKLGAGSVYTAEFWGHTTTMAVRNVYVTYSIVVKVAATLNLKLITEGSPIGTPEEGSTGGDPPPIPVISALDYALAEFWADVGEWFNNPINILYIILVLVIIIGVIYVIIKMRFGGG